MMTYAEMKSILDLVAYSGFTFNLKLDDARPYLQMSALDTCNVTGEKTTWQGRKWLLSYHMTTSEIVSTCLKAVLTALEHEAREKFTYRAVTVYDPHICVETLVSLRRGDGVHFENHGLDERHHIERGLS